LFIFVKLLTNWNAIDYDNNDEDGDNDDEGERGEDALVLARRKEDNYPLLPAFDSNTPLDVLKRILRVYVREVRSMYSGTLHYVSSD
jgi:hypothetical protein